MNSISAIRAFVPPDISAMGAAGGGATNTLKQSGGLTAAEFDKLAASVEVGAGAEAGVVQGAPGASTSFEQMLKEMVRDVQAKQAASSEAVAGVLAGDGTTLHEAMLASEESSLSFQLMVEVRNKVLETYQELMRMQL